MHDRAHAELFAVAGDGKLSTTNAIDYVLCLRRAKRRHSSGIGIAKGLGPIVAQTRRGGDLGSKTASARLAMPDRLSADR
jgi:hypothetical protein